MKPTTAYLINSMLHDVFKGSTFDQKNTYMMAKTGQTNFDQATMDTFAKKGQYYEEIEGINKSYITIYDNQAYLAKDYGYYEYFLEGTQPLTYPNYEIRA